MAGTGEKQNKKTSAKAPSETVIVKNILKYLNGLPGCYAVKIHGNVHMQGQPDILGACYGKPLALEVKRPGNKPTKLQLKRLRQWAAGGAVADVVFSVDQVKKLVKELSVKNE